MSKEHLVRLRSEVWFREFVDRLLEEAPNVRPWNPRDERCVDEWKADSMRREGYIQCLLKFGYKLEDLDRGKT